jgi:hypothetical protein
VLRRRSPQGDDDLRRQPFDRLGGIPAKLGFVLEVAAWKQLSTGNKDGDADAATMLESELNCWKSASLAKVSWSMRSALSRLHAETMESHDSNAVVRQADETPIRMSSR